MNPTKKTGPLEGITVIELGGFIAGPFAGQLLGDYGARVIKIEPPAGDPMRHWGTECNDQSLWWPGIARNKESIVLDLATDGDRELARTLFRQADVVLENFAPGRLASWGLDHRSVVADNPGLVMAHVSGFGQTGPRATDRGFGSIAEAMGGLRALMGFPELPPVRAGISIGDALAGMFAVIGILAALRERDSTGVGQEVDVALYESVFALTESLMADWEVADVTRTRSGSTLPGVAPSNVYSARDGVEVLVAANADNLFKRLTAAMERPDLADDERYATHQARGANAVELDEIVGAWCATLDGDELEKRLDEYAIPRGRIYTPRDIAADEQYAAREMITRLDAPGFPAPVPMPSVVPKFTGTPGSIRTPGPDLGQHTEAIRAEFAD